MAQLQLSDVFFRLDSKSKARDREKIAMIRYVIASALYHKLVSS